MKRTSILVAVVALAGVLSGCAAGAKSREPVQASSPPTRTVAPTPVPAPAGKPVLTLTGLLGNHNRGANLLFDQRTLDAMATQTQTFTEPFAKKDISFTGIPMSVLLSRAGIPPTAKGVRVHAIDDYKVTFKLADLMAPGVLLATKAGGAPIPVADGGPIRLVFPPDSAVGKNRDIWIWSIDSMTIT
jgi:hypothetical protein